MERDDGELSARLAKARDEGEALLAQKSAESRLNTEGDPNCNHGVTFDQEAARAMLSDWRPDSPLSFVMGDPATCEIRKRWPRLFGPCPKGCGYNGIHYASWEHYTMGDW